MHLARRPGGGYRVRYAIADVAAHVAPGGALEAETWRRGQTVYLPDGNVPLHPHTLSEGAASLLPDDDRAAVVWTIDLDADGGTVGRRAGTRPGPQPRQARLRRACRRPPTPARLPEPIALLPEIGDLLTARGPAPGRDQPAAARAGRRARRRRLAAGAARRRRRWRSTTRRSPC